MSSPGSINDRVETGVLRQPVGTKPPTDLLITVIQFTLCSILSVITKTLFSVISKTVDHAFYNHEKRKTLSRMNKNKNLL